MFEKQDKAIIREYLKEGKQPAGEKLTVKQYVCTTDGDVTKGIAKTFVWNEIIDYGVITGIEQSDIVYSGGLYQIGDIKVQLTRELKAMDDVTQQVGDRIVWREHEYRQVGAIMTNYLEGYCLYNYVFRRI
jgi:hypothetical protein